jgi:uncharacterized membrane protein
MPVISNDSNVILKYFHFVLLVVFFFFILFMLSNGPPSFIYALVSVFQLLTAESMFFVGVHWMAFVSHVKFRKLQTQR